MSQNGVRLGSLARDHAHGNQLRSTSRAYQRAERGEPSAGSSQPPTQARPPSALASERKASNDVRANRGGGWSLSPATKRSASQVKMSLVAQGSVTAR